MKKLLFALALTAFVGGPALASHDSDKDKDAKKGAKKECSTEAKSHCSKEMAGGGAKSCCASKNKTAMLITPKPEPKEAEAKKVL